MTDRDHDPEELRRVSSRYRELGAEEPPRALDDAILAAARREAGARPGSPGRAAPQRWYASVAAAAVLVLAVAVTVHLQSERPDIAEPAPRAKQASTLPAAAPQRAEVAKEAVKDAAEQMLPKSADMARRSEPEPFPAKEERVMAERRTQAAPQAAAPASASSDVLSSRSDEARGSASSVASAIARQAEDRASREAEALARAPQAAPVPAMAKRAPAQANLPADTPERELERVAELRLQGRHDEADKALAEFRKRYPDFKISEAMRERVERR